MMQWLNELVWIGNVLYPRWFVFGIPLAVVCCIVTLAIVISYLRSV